MNHPFTLTGVVTPLAKAARGVDGHTPTRPMGGWATTYGKLMPDGTLVPTIDRDDQVMACASELDGIDWSGYLKEGAGFWNDNHLGGTSGDRKIKVGMGTRLEFAAQESDLAQEHRKVGWFTAGHFWDPDDPASWTAYTRYSPNATDLKRADAYWDMASRHMDGADRTLGFSVDGLMRTSPCRKRIIKAWVQEIAIAPGPSNPDCTVEPMAKAAGLSVALPFLAPGLIGLNETPAECGKCCCGPNMCGLLRKSAPDLSELHARILRLLPSRYHDGETHARAALQRALLANL